MTNIQDDPKIVQWFELSELSDSTKMNYSIYMRSFCECVEMTPTQLIEEAIKETKMGLMLSERKTMTYLTKFKQCLTKNKYAPKTEGLALATVRSFYKTHDIQLSSGLGKMKKRMPLRENQNFLEREDVIKLVTNSKNLREKAIILMMATSGMAMREILDLKIKDIKFDDSGVGIVYVRREKAQVDYLTFISPESVLALNNYFEERNREIKLKVKGNDDYIFVTYEPGRNGGKSGNRISRHTLMRNFRELGSQLGYKNGANLFVKSRSHTLRKYFASTLENAGFPKNKIDFMLGHTPNGNDFAYFRTNVDSLKQLYIKYLPYLTFEKTIEVRSLDTKDAEMLEELKKENKQLMTDIESIKRQRNEDNESIKRQNIKENDAISEFTELMKKEPKLLETLKKMMDMKK